MNQNSRISKKRISRVDVVTTAEFSGPLPHPAILERYEYVLPGMADRIVSMAEQQAKHRRDMEDRVIRSNIRSEVIGAVITFLITLVCISGSIYLIATNKQVAGFLTMVSTLLTLVYNFYSGKHAEKEEVRKMNEVDQAASADKQQKL